MQVSRRLLSRPGVVSSCLNISVVKASRKSSARMPVFSGIVRFYKTEARSHILFSKVSGHALVEDIDGMCKLCNYYICYF